MGICSPSTDFKNSNSFIASLYFVVKWVCLSLRLTYFWTTFCSSILTSNDIPEPLDGLDGGFWTLKICSFCFSFLKVYSASILPEFLSFVLGLGLVSFSDDSSSLCKPSWFENSSSLLATLLTLLPVRKPKVAGLELFFTYWFEGCVLPVLALIGWTFVFLALLDIL